MVYGAAGLSKTKQAPLFPDNGLSITERYFHRIPEDKNQVVMIIAFKLTLPPQATHVSENRLVEIAKLSQSKHYRLASYVDYETQEVRPFGPTAAHMSLLHRFVPADAPDTWRSAFDEEINANFDVRDMSKPLWKVAIVGPPAVAGSGISVTPTASASTSASESAPATASAIDGEPLVHLGPSPAPVLPGTNEPLVFDIILTFHHCLGDGLSMLAFARTFLADCTAANLNAESLRLDLVPVSTDMPPLLDNYINPSFLSILPTAVGMAAQFSSKKNLHKFKHLMPSPSSTSSTSSPPSAQPAIVTTTTSSVNAPAPPSADLPSGASAVAPKRPLIIADMPTHSRNLMYDADFVADLRKNTKANGTTIAALLIVNALAAVRGMYAPEAKALKKHLPRHQGWVVTSSMRHLLPNSGLLHGSDKQSDPSLMVFGGYSSSVSDAGVTIDEKREFWERCRSVRRTIGGSFFTSMRRMKFANWVYRHPKLFNFLQKNADIASLTRAYSVELANLGAWDYPGAPPDAPDSDDRARLRWFGGTLSTSFEGARALFTLGVVTLGSDMSVTIAYDKSAVTEEQADRFTALFQASMEKLRTTSGKVKLGELVPPPV
ncbi:hypothetical protein BC831DRAFT_467995 [Entophlyctis helioformis]|nr:hypothetical protein BC831DRAFT_467995 [Entophlyctis helioformis]